MSRLGFAALFLVIPLVRAQPPEVAVCVRYGVAINLMVVKIGESTASQMFEPTGVRLRWTSDPRFHIHVVSKIKADAPDISIRAHWHRPCRLPTRESASCCCTIG